MVLNKKHVIISSLDIFSRVGKAAAYDEVTSFTVDSGSLTVQGETSSFRGTLSVEFAKVSEIITPSELTVSTQFSHKSGGESRIIRIIMYFLT